MQFWQLILSSPSLYMRSSLSDDINMWVAFKNEIIGQRWWFSGLAPPSAQGVILGPWDRVPHRAPHREPASLSPRVSAYVSHE